MKVVCKINDNYPSLTVGKEYEVDELMPQFITEHFTFPRYVRVVDDGGNISQGHAYRFDTLDGVSCEEYIKENIKDIKDMS